MKSPPEFTAEEQIREFFTGRRARAARIALTWHANGQHGGLRRLPVKFHEIDRLEAEALSKFRREARGVLVNAAVTPARTTPVTATAMAKPAPTSAVGTKAAAVPATASGVLGKGGKPKRVRRWSKKPVGWVETEASRKQFEAARAALHSGAVRSSAAALATAVGATTMSIAPGGSIVAPAKPAPGGLIVAPAKPAPGGLIDAPAKAAPGGLIDAPAKPAPGGLIDAPAKPAPGGPMDAPAKAAPGGPMDAPAKAAPGGPMDAPAKAAPGGPIDAPAKPAVTDQPAKPVVEEPLRPAFPGGPTFSPRAMNTSARELAERLVKSFLADCQGVGAITLDNPPGRNAGAKVREEAAYLLHNRRVEKLNKLFFDVSNQVDDWARIQNEPLKSAKDQLIRAGNRADNEAIDQLSTWIHCVNRCAKLVVDRLTAVHQRADALLKQSLRKHLQEV